MSITLEDDARVSGFAGWFTADFHGTEANPCPCPVTLSTGPENGYTHWGQQVFHLQVPHDVVGGGKVQGTIAVKRQKENVRLVSRGHGDARQRDAHAASVLVVVCVTASGGARRRCCFPAVGVGDRRPAGFAPTSYFGVRLCKL